MHSRILWISFTALGLTCLGSSEPSMDDLVYRMEHDLGTGSFSTRGNIHLPGAKRKDSEVTVDQDVLDLNEMQSLNSRGGHGLYRLKVNAMGKTDNSTIVMGFAHKNELKSASLHDVIDLYSDEMGNVVSVSVRPMRDVAETRYAAEFNTVLIAHSPSPAPVPDTAGYLDKLKEEKIQKEKEEKNPKSFIGRYWMYMIPVVMFMFMSNAAQQQGA